MESLEGTDLEAMKTRQYICIDLKSFYASVECVERGLDPMTTHLLVADSARTEKTICLAVSPSLKAYGIGGRARLFEAVQALRRENERRIRRAPGQVFAGSSYDAKELAEHPELEAVYITAVPRMAYYIQYSTRIYQIYLKYVAPEDMHVYSIDEVFFDVTDYLSAAGMTAQAFARQMVAEVQRETGITATAGIGTNLYLAKIAMDIVAKHIQPDRDGARIASLDEQSYRRQLWTHRPLTDFWRVGRGYARKLETHGLYTMGDIARCSIGKETDYYNEDLLYKLFGINAELLIDHAWGWEPCTIEQVRQYRPAHSSISSGQVLQCPYEAEKARLVLQEMTDLLVLDLVDKGLMTNQLVLTVGYDVENLTDPARQKQYRGAVAIDRYGRKVPKHAHGTANLQQYSSSTRQIMEAVLALYDRIVNPALLVRRLTLAANQVLSQSEVQEDVQIEQLDLFTDYQALERQRAQEAAELAREKRMQNAMLEIKKRFGKNAILKGMNLQEGATARERNQQIGGHRE